MSENSETSIPKVLGSWWLKSASQTMQLDTEFTDCVVIVGSKKFKCHKLILATASEYFKRLFLGNFKESLSAEIHLEDVTPFTFTVFNKYMYTYDKADLAESSVHTLMDVYECGHRFLVPTLTKDCLHLLNERVTTVTMEDLIDLFVLGHKFNEEDLIRNATLNLIEKYPEHLSCDAALQLDADMFQEYVRKVFVCKTQYEHFKLIDKYLKVNGHDESIVPENNILGAEEPNNDDINKNPEEIKEIKVKESESIENPKKDIASKLLTLIDFTQMTGREFYDGPAKSKLLSMEAKLELLYAIHSERIKNLTEELEKEKLAQQIGINVKPNYQFNFRNLPN